MGEEVSDFTFLNKKGGAMPAKKKKKAAKKAAKKRTKAKATAL